MGVGVGVGVGEGEKRGREKREREICLLPKDRKMNAWAILLFILIVVDLNYNAPF